MKLYRGQVYGHAVGSWWTSNRDDARAYAHSRGAWAWVVLEVEIDARKIARHLFDRTAAGSTYKLSLGVLRTHALAVRVVDGFLQLPPAAS